MPTGTVNYYVIGESKENLDKTFSVISPVRGDGTNVLFNVYENGDLTESVIKINDVENMTTNEIWEAISQGDYEIISWLENYLSSYGGGLLIVSHDRYFLDRLTARTLELERGKVLSFKGNYSKYKVLKEELLVFLGLGF